MMTAANATAALIANIRNASDLDDLLAAVKAVEAHHRSLDYTSDEAEDLRTEFEHVIMDLPTWGPEPDLTTEGIMSWDAGRVLWMEDDWHLTTRQDVEAATDAVLTGDAADVIAMLPGTQRSRAARLGVSEGTVSEWISGNHEMPRSTRHLVLALLGYQMSEDGQWERVR